MSASIYVWDRLVRLFHWSLVLLFLTSYLSAENEQWIHVYSGYGIITLLSIRIVWGFIGSRHARFTDFIYAPGKALGYATSLTTGRKPKRYLGHNPAGGLMVLAMLLTLCTICFSGLKLYAAEEGKGPFAQHYGAVDFLGIYQDSEIDDRGDQEPEYNGSRELEDDREDLHNHEDDEDFWEDIHETFVNLLIFLVILHIVGVILSSRAHGESLVRSMVTGLKKREDGA